MNVNNNIFNADVLSEIPKHDTNSVILSQKVTFIALGVIFSLGGMVAASYGDLGTAGIFFACAFVNFAVAALMSIDFNQRVYSKQDPNGYFPQSSLIIFQDNSFTRPQYLEGSSASFNRSFDRDHHVIPGGAGREIWPGRGVTDPTLRQQLKTFGSFDSSNHVIPGGVGRETKSERRVKDIMLAEQSRTPRPLDRDHHVIPGGAGRETSLKRSSSN